MRTRYGDFLRGRTEVSICDRQQEARAKSVGRDKTELPILPKRLLTPFSR